MLACNLLPKEVQCVGLHYQALAGVNLLCSWGRNFTLAMLLISRDKGRAN